MLTPNSWDEAWPIIILALIILLAITIFVAVRKRNSSKPPQTQASTRTQARQPDQQA